MTKNQLVKGLEEIRGLYINDSERARFMAEQLLLEFIDDERVTDLFDSIS